MRFIKNHKLLLLLIAGLLLRLLISFQTYSGDVNNHISWGKDVLANGTQGIYGREFMPAYGTLTPTYPPIPIFLFTVSQALYDWTYNTSWYLNNTCKVFPSNFIFFLEDQDTLPAFHKLPAIFADIGLAFLTYLLVKKIVKKDNEKYGLFAASLVLFNPAFFYNSAYWGQIEAIPLFFLLCSLYLLFYKENYLLNAFTFSLALLTKQAVIIFIPVYALLFYMKFGLLKSVKGVLVNILTFLLLFFPFYDKGSVLYFPFSTYWNKIQTGSGSDYVVDHAFNFWSLTTGPGKIHDYLVPFLLSYRNWGYLIFFTLVVGVLCRLIKSGGIKNRFFLYALYITGFSSFLFMTRMHERYLEYTLPFLLLISIKDKRMLYGFIFLSLFSFLNLYHNWWAPRINPLVNLLSSVDFVNLLTIIAITFYAYSLYRFFNKNGVYEQ